jgi:hypothetical protein
MCWSEYLIFVKEREFRCPAGSFVFIPAGQVHGFRVGDVPSRKPNIYSPAALVGYFDELERAAATSEPLDDESMSGPVVGKRWTRAEFFVEQA